MTITAELADGRRLEFPDGTDPSVVQATVKRMISEQPEQPKKKETTLGGVASEVAKGAVRGPSDIGMLMGKFATQSALGPFIGPIVAKEVVEKLAAPSREMVRATPNTPAERFAGTGAEILSGAAVSGGMSNAPNTVMSIISALGGATGEQLGGETGKMVGSMAPGLSIPAVSLLGMGYRGGRNLFDPMLFPGGVERSASRGVQEALGGRRAAVEAELAKNQQIVPGSPVTAAEAAAWAGSAELSALQKLAAAKADPSGYRDIEKAQQAARVAALNTLGGKKPGTEWDEAIANAERIRAENARRYNEIGDRRIDPRSETQMMDEAIAAREAQRRQALQAAGRYQTTAAQQENLAHGGSINLNRVQPPNEPMSNVGALGGTTVSPSAYPVPGQPRIPGRYTENMERVPEARAAAEYALAMVAQRGREAQYLKDVTESLKNTVGLDSGGFAQFIGRPSINDALKHMAEVAQEGRRYYPTAAGDKFSISNLQDIKKSLDSQIKAANNAEQAGRVPPIPAAELENTRKAFINWLSSRSEDWKQARLQYREDSSPINRMEVGRFLENKLVAPLGQERGSSFAQAVREAPKTITSAVTGRPRFRRLDEVLTPKENETVINVLTEELRAGNVREMAAAGMQRAGKIAGGLVNELPPTGAFQPVLSAARSWVNRAAGAMDDKALAVIAEKLKTPEGAMQLISRLPPETQKEFFKQVNEAAKMASVRGAGVTME